MKIVIEASVPYLRGIAEQFGDVEYLQSNDFDKEHLKDADALIIRSITKCNAQNLEGTSVKLITTATAGFDHIDQTFCKENGIVWKNSPGCNADAVAQYVASALSLMAIRLKTSLEGLTIGIVGVGHVGRRVELIARAFGMKVLRNDPPREEKEGSHGFCSIDEIMKKSDVVTFHTPLNRDSKFPTYHLINDELLKKAQKTPILINACRGAVADSKALIKAKNEGIIKALIIDCWEGEPDINRQLLSLADIATPHIAGFSADGKCNGAKMCLENISKFFDIPSEALRKMQPEDPENPLININQFEDNRVYRTQLESFNPEKIDKILRLHPENFETLRKTYSYPREMKAYTVRGASEEEIAVLNKLGFNAMSY
ncbi:4-phosphoerythronate dehydrogenase PdxB [Falsiporphyromonas endometrii]|uniref:Erythronate-4-phosphate dehydrogenase n=1 Tax=Falsiporphyromonas endometrii TaxID=1387297 RepID=A0ABV9KAG4_9PORP